MKIAVFVTASKDGFSPELIGFGFGFGFGPTITAPGFDAAAPLGAARLLLLLGAALCSSCDAVA